MSRRDYGQLATIFWIRGSGKRLRGDALGQTIAAYLATSPSSNMIGLYYVAVATIAHETGHDDDDVRAALSRVAKAGFAFYDEEAELVWIPNHAAKEIGETMKVGDKRRGMVLRELAAVGNHAFADQFRERYGRAFSLPDHDPEAPSVPENAPRKGHPRSSGRSETKTETDQDQGERPKQEPEIVAQLEETQAHVDATGSLPAPRRRAKGAFGIEIDRWCTGVAAITGKTCSKPRNEQAASLVACLADHCPDDADICDFAEAAAQAYASSGARTISVAFFVDWMNSPSGYVSPSAAAPPSRASGPANVAKGEPSDVGPPPAETVAALQAMFDATSSAVVDLDVRWKAKAS